MKKIIYLFALTIFLSCSKEYENCWECTVYRDNGSTYKATACREDDNPPKFTDENGNDLNSDCVKK